MVSLVDPVVPEAEKIAMIKELLNQKYPESLSEFRPQKPMLRNNIELKGDTLLRELIGSKSWFLFSMLQIKFDEVRSWVTNDVLNKSSIGFVRFKSFIDNIQCINDCSERNIQLVQDFIMSSHKEDHRQNVMLISKAHRKKID